jgi:hypothetical protein
MRIRTGHRPEDWTESIPASTGSSRLGGELVIGGPGAVEQARIQSRAHQATHKAKEIVARKAETA